MAKQTGPVFYYGTFGNINYYQCNGQWLLRGKSSLDEDRVKTDPVFANSRRASDGFGNASILAQKIYYQLPDHKRGKGIFGKITGRVNSMLHKGLTQAATEKAIFKEFDA